ncbi:hypothetical protein CPB85DRAFT_1327065 [Mucidula mucida]|nr:hypothetical protein CPB85DRAFT_1327065 [Mucidula mucida]
MSLMFRGHLFTVVVVGGYARLVRWDRRGSIVTNRFKYTKGPGALILFEFYLRFAQLTRTQRGLDPTVMPVADDDPDAKRARAKFSLYHSDILHCEAKAVRADVAPVSERLFWVTLTVDGTMRRFIIPAPKFHWGCLLPFSHSTCRSLAYDPSKDLDNYVDNAPPSPTSRFSLFFMKDYWQEPSTQTKPKAEIYRLLAQHKVPNVAEMEVGGDIPGMITPAQAAFTLARILHRDISVGNIMITPKDRGVLIDWDLCLVLDSNVVTHHPGRTGTWQFVLVHLLNGRLPHGGDAGKQSITHSLVDNRESVFWVLLYIALLHLKHKSPPTDLHNKLIKWFDFNTVDDYHRDTGSDEKLNCLRGWADYVCTPVDFGIPGLNALFTELAQVFIDGPDSVHVRTTPYGQYVLGGQHMESASWLYDTLRQYATDMPTPVQPAAVKNPERSACCAVPVIYDFVVNHFYPSFMPTATRKRTKF